MSNEASTCRIDRKSVTAHEEGAGSFRLRGSSAWSLTAARA